MSFAATRVLELFALLAAQNPTWPPADPDLPPESLARPEHMPGDPDYAPRPDLEIGCAGQTELFSFTPTCTPAIAGSERNLGSGVHADRAWLITTGHPAAVVGVADTGADWSDPEVAGRWRLNAGELPPPHDRNGDGAFTVRDYTSATGTAAPSIASVVDVALASRGDRGDTNGNAILDPQDLIRVFSNGRDDDGNGLIDDVAGWDFLDGDNDAADLLPGGHGARQARIIAAEANNGIGGAGVCPRCLLIPFRVATEEHAPASALSAALRDAEIIAAGVVPAGGVLPADAGRLVIAPAGNTSSVHRVGPWPADAVIAGSIGYDAAARDRATTAASPDPCGSFGAQLTIAAPGRCDESAGAIAAGVAGLVVSAAAGIDKRGVPPISPPLSAREIASILSASADPLPQLGAPAPPSGTWTAKTGYGRTNARAAVDAVLRRDIPPEAEIEAPAAYAMIDPTSGDGFVVFGHVANRRHDQADWQLDYATGLAPVSAAFSAVASGTLARGESLRVRAEIPTLGLFRDPVAPPARPTDPAVTIRLSMSARSGGSVVRTEVRRLVFIHRDLYLLPGFPVSAGAAVHGGPRVVDLDGDGKEEVVAATGAGTVHAFTARGAALSGFPLSLPGSPAIIGAAAIAALEGDDAPLAIVLASLEGRVYRVTAQGKLHGGFPVEASTSTIGPRAIYAGPLIEDLDGDGALDVLVATAGGVLDAWSASGARLSGYPIRLPEPIGAPAAGDVDGDGKNDIVAASHRRVYLVRAGGGGAHAGWPAVLPAASQIAVPGFARSSGTPSGPPPGVILANAGGGRDLEIAVVPIGRSPIVFTAAGTVRRGDFASSRDVIGRNADVRLQGDPIFAAGGEPSAADLDGDGRLDVVAGAATHAFLRGPSPGAVDAVEPLAAAWSLGDGKFTSGFPVGTGDRFRGGFTIADLDADGRPEAIFGDGQYRLHAVSSAGVSPKGWPKATAGAVTGTPAAGDLDGDGRLEVVAATAEGLVFAWRTEGRAADRIPWEGARHDHRATGNVETETTRRGAVQNDEGCGCRSTGRDQKALWLLACAGLCGLIARRPAR